MRPSSKNIRLGTTCPAVRPRGRGRWTRCSAPPACAAVLLVGLGLVASAPASAQDPAALGREASAAPEIVLTFEEAAVVAAGLTPGGEAAFFSVSREPQGYYQRVVRRSGLETVDSFGEARFEPQEGAVPPKSVWAVADVASGAFEVGAPEGFLLQEIPFPGNAFEVGAPGLVNRLRHTFTDVDLLLVRPGVGAWRLRASDTGPRDRDGVDDDRSVTAPEDATPIAADPETAPPPPDRYAEDDVLVVINPRDLRFYAARLIGPPA